MDKMPGVGIENTNEYMYSMVSYGYISYGFDVSAIPEGSVIDSVTCKAKAKRSSSGTTGILQLYSGTTAKGSATTFTDGSMATYTLNAGTWSWDEIQKIRLRITASSTQQYKYIYFYGADLTVTYTYQNEKFMLKLTPSTDENILPEGYTRLEYIESSGTQYINTGHKATSENYRIKCKFATTNNEINTVLFGGGASTDIISALLLGTDQVKFYVGSGSVSSATAAFVRGAECELECHANTGTFTVNLDGMAYSGSYSGAINKDYPLFIFANNASGSASQFSSIRLYAFQIYDNGTLVRNYLPCLNPSGTPGLYDIVNGVFYGSATSTPFVAGPEYNKVWHDIARVFKKVNGIWVEQEELANVIEDGVRYKNGGEYVAPVKKISFTIAGTSYQAEEGMTWGEWVASSYNTGGFTVDSSGIYQRSSDSYVQTSSYKLVASSETITSGYGYVLAW